MSPQRVDRKIFVAGDQGQLGRQLLESIDHATVAGASQFDLDLRDANRCCDILDDIKPDVIVNCAAYTAVDAAEQDQEAAFAVNAEVPAMLARWCAANGCHLVQISTDYVFSGRKPLFESYTEADLTEPVSVYGRSKLLGEESIKLHESLRYSILRTAWLYGVHGSNFLKTMLRLVLAQPERDFKVVSDQFGSPTSTDALVREIHGVINNHAYGTFHATSHGYCSWYEFACEFFAELGIEHCLRPCSTADYPTAAQRPANSILANDRLLQLGLDFFVDWRDDLALFVESYGRQLIAEASAA